MEASQVPVALGQEEPVRIEPGRRLPVLQIRPGPLALFGMVGEGACVQQNPIGFILAGDEGPQGDSRREPWLVHRIPQRAPHLPQGADAAETGGGGEPGRRGQVSVCPDPYRQRALLGQHRTGQGQAQAAPAVSGVDHQFPASALGRVGKAKVGVAFDPLIEQPKKLAATTYLRLPGPSGYRSRYDAAALDRVVEGCQNSAAEHTFVAFRNIDRYENSKYVIDKLG